ncbi:hypothetical protein SAMN05880501_101526 [Ureibacillus xyleni]|uniref:Uncharacterized protein n=1 Tax=Ureibacillus xyleni TaxID=614648 RepID=A0A285RFW5_9BACL|nr:hypothetical protein [Ureibacillus xyleni]SOB92618.1 hypothetical protein SAMN05880501_101526 [Ureibacillus xyleni]
MKKIYLVFLFVIALVILPSVVWWLTPQKQLNVAIIDKTVPDETYREHLGFMWALNYFKYRNEEGRFKEDDYFGTIPKLDTTTVQTNSLPKDYSNIDVIYLADTYGVYKDDLNENLERDGARSEKIVGGLDIEEWNNIVNRLTSNEKSLLVAEYNSFASPTQKEVRDAMLDYLNINWTGWIGRYFYELDPEKNSEIPQWIVEDFGENWNYNGGGFVLVNNFLNEVIVLELDKHISEEGIRLQYTDEGQAFFNINSNPKYDYWFDIITASNQENVLANYQWALTDSGREILEEKGVPISFAAVINNDRKNAKAYYFAGDYNDISKVPFFYQFKGLATVYKYAQMFSDDGFYWSSYLPMMESILTDFNETTVVQGEQKRNDELQYNAKINDQQFEILKDGKWESITFKGVNIGMAKPGYFPGEAAITEEEYYRWFEQIGEMNANTIRVYTLHPPAFYHALVRYNEKADAPLYVLHGIWIDEESLEQTLDAYDKEILSKFHDEMKTIVNVIHGNKNVEPQAGHASGIYDSDISQYVIGWIIGIEWYPPMVKKTNELYATIGQYDGEYFKTQNASAFEYWLAEQMDFLTQYEYEKYKWIRPMSFTNWVTTDVLEHPSEPSVQEDLVSVNPNVIQPKGLANETGQFASYHVYPYYPDFLNYDQEYLNYIDHRGEKNSYAGYLADLRAAHHMPVLIAEFGIPSSRGLTHENPFGWNQGFVSEQKQGEILTHLYEDIIAEDYLGGLIFSWQDEWFKRTWNTMDYDNPERRPYWSNAQTNEQQFGLLSFDQHKIRVDGDLTEWTSTPLYESKGKTPSLSLDVDERYLYIQLNGELLNTNSPRILLDIVPNQGKTSASGVPNAKFSNGVDFIIELNRNKNTQIIIDPYFDYYSYIYGHQLKMIDTESINEKAKSNKFSPIYYALNKKFTLPESGETIPFKSYETGKLLQGNGNFANKDYNSLIDFSWSNENKIELRIPWLLIQAKDPSKKEFMGDFYKNGEDASVFVDEIFIGSLFVNDEGQVVDTLPSMQKGNLQPFKSFTWENWEQPISKERLKQSYEIIQNTFGKYK